MVSWSLAYQRAGVWVCVPTAEVAFFVALMAIRLSIAPQIESTIEQISGCNDSVPWRAGD